MREEIDHEEAMKHMRTFNVGADMRGIDAADYIRYMMDYVDNKNGWQHIEISFKEPLKEEESEWMDV